MNASSIGTTIFNSLPSWLKGTAVFTHVENAYDPVTGVMTPTTTTASARCVTQPAKGTQSESFLNITAIREKYIVVTVPAADLGSFVPKAGDTVTISSTVFRLTGIETTQPDGSSAVVYRATAERING